MTGPQYSKSFEGLSHDPVTSSSSSFPYVDSSESPEASPDMDLHHSPVHVAHVATDDKSLLAHLAELASSPPLSVDCVETSSSALVVSAPVWQDEEIEDFPCDLGRSSSISMPMSPFPAPLFPPPPSKEKMAAPAFYDYPYSFEDITLELEAEPSAPPFEDPPSAPPTNNTDLTPSAPLMDTDYLMELHASTPHDWGPDGQLLDGAEREDSSHPAAIYMIPPDNLPQAVVLASDMDTVTAMRAEGHVRADGSLPRYHP